jgi:hypothetical protein
MSPPSIVLKTWGYSLLITVPARARSTGCFRGDANNDWQWLVYYATVGPMVHWFLDTRLRGYDDGENIPDSSGHAPG